MGALRLTKSERLCSRTAVDRLFAEGHTAIAYPLRAVWRVREAGDYPLRMMVTIPKKKQRHAVDRVLLRRRVREAYRLNRRALLMPVLEGDTGHGVDLAIVYLSNERARYRVIEDKLRELLSRIAHQLTNAATPDTP